MRIFSSNNLTLMHECHGGCVWILESLFLSYCVELQNGQLLERLKDTFSSSYVSYCHMVDCLEDSHDMMDHEKPEKLQGLDVFEYYLDEIQSCCGGRGT